MQVLRQHVGITHLQDTQRWRTATQKATEAHSRRMVAMRQLGVIGEFIIGTPILESAFKAEC